MFYPKTKSMVSGADKLTAQAREAGAMAAARATQGVQTAQTATGKTLMKGVFSARGWVAPRLESVADYTTDTVAPKVSCVLRDTARQISPPNSRNKGSRSALRWSLLATAACTAAGAAVLLARQRYRAAMAADSEGVEAPAQPESATETEPTTPAGPAPTEGSADSGANGKVSASG